MIDIHTHFLPFVDDGSDSLKDSINLIKEEKLLGVSDVFLTPHYRKEMFEESKEKIIFEFNNFKNEIEKEKIDINVYLGQELFIRSVSHFRSILEKRDEIIFDINNSNCILLEFSYTIPTNIEEIVHLSKVNKLQPIIAHVERYEYLNIERIFRLKMLGALIQINASSIVGADGRGAQKLVRKLLENNLVDFVSSDMHQGRINYLKKAYDYCTKNYDTEIVQNIFENDARDFLL